MEKIFLIGLMYLLSSFSLQAAEKTLEERLEAAKKNSEIALEKIGAFQKDFAKESTSTQTTTSKKKRESSYCKSLVYPPYARLLAEFGCKALQKHKWKELRCYTSDKHVENLKPLIKKIKESQSYYYEEFSKFPCQIKSPKETDYEAEMMHTRQKFVLEEMGTIEVDYTDKWKIINVELN